MGRLACYVEIELCGDPIGKQDQYAAAFGGLNLIRFHVDDSVTIEPIICKPETIKKMEESIIVFYTGRTRSATSLLFELTKNLGNDVKNELMKEMVQLAYDLKLQLEANENSKLEERFNQDIEELSQETESLVNEIDKWQT